MLLSFDRGRPLCVIRGGKNDNKIISMFDPKKKCCEKCNSGCRKNPKCCVDCMGNRCGRMPVDQPDIEQAVFDVINDDFVRSKKKKMTSDELNKIKKSLKSDKNLENNELREICDLIKEELNIRSRKEFTIHDDGIIKMLPNFESSWEHAYIAGPTGSGKSYQIKKLAEEMRLVYPDKKIYVISEVEEDPLLDKIQGGVRRLDIEELLENPKEPEFFRDCLLIFDDIDSIEDKDNLKAINAMRDAYLKRGSKTNTSVIVSSHLISNYKETRVVLNECSTITIFPKSGCTNGIEYVLKRYVGLGKDQIRKIFELPTRSVTIYKRYPMFVVYDHGIYLL